MTLPLIIAIVPTILFGIIAIIYTIKEHNLRIRLRENESHILNSLIDSLEDAACMIDSKNQITAINKVAKDLLKIQKDNPTLTDMLSALPNTLNFPDKIQKTITLGHKSVEKDIPFQEKLLNITIYPVQHTNDSALQKHEAPLSGGQTPAQLTNIIGAMFLIQDVTKEKPLAKMKEDFTNIIVHELRSPLTSIKASSEMLTGENNLSEEEKKRLLSIINEQTGKMLDEVSMILDAAKLDSGLFTIQKINGDLKKVIEDTASSFRTTAQDKFINLVLNVDPFIPQAIFDAYHIHRVIVNLLTNSFKFTPRGGTVTVHAWRSADKTFVSVADTGSGIPADKQHLLFTKFAQIKTPNATVGTGLGLYISKGIIEAHGGTISMQSEPGKGTTVTFTLPTLTQAQVLAPSTPTSEKPLNPMAN